MRGFMMVFMVLILLLASPAPVYLDRYKTPPRLTVHMVSRATEYRELVVTATAYSYTGHRTATGTRPQRGTVAVDPNLIKLGSKLFIEGYGPARAEDTGGLIKGNRIDLFMETETEAMAWGRRTVRARVEE